MECPLDWLHILCTFLLSSLAKGNHISIGPGAYSSNKTLAGGPRNILVLGSCEFMHNGTVLNVNFYVASPDWLYLQIWRPLYDDDNTMQVIYQKLVIPDITEDILQVWLANEDVRVQVGDMVGFTKLNNTFPIPYIFKPQMSSDLWYHALDGAGDMVSTGQHLAFEELGFPYHFSVTVTFRPDIPNLYDTLREEESNTNHTWSLDSSPRPGHSVMSGTDTWLGDKKERWPYNPVTKTFLKSHRERENIARNKPPGVAAHKSIARISVPDNRPAMGTNEQSGSKVTSMPSQSNATVSPNHGKPTMRTDDSNRVYDSKGELQSVTPPTDIYKVQHKYADTAYSNTHPPAAPADPTAILSPSTPMDSIVTDELYVIDDGSVDSDIVDDIRGEYAITEAPFSTLHATKQDNTVSSPSNIAASFAKSPASRHVTSVKSLPVSDETEVLPVAVLNDTISSSVSEKSSNIQQNTLEPLIHTKLPTSNNKNESGH